MKALDDDTEYCKYPTANETAVTSVTNVSVHLYQNYYPFTLKQQQYTKCPTDPNQASRATLP